MHREFPVAASTCSSSDRRCWKSWRVTWKWSPLIPLLLLGVVCTHAQRQRHPDEISLASPMHADIKINESVVVSQAHQQHSEEPAHEQDPNKQAHDQDLFEDELVALGAEYADAHKEQAHHTDSHAHEPFPFESSAPPHAVLQCEEKVLVKPESYCKDNVTLATIATIDRLSTVLSSAAHWDGYVSLVLYSRGMHEYQVIEAFVTDELAPFCQNRQMPLTVTVVSYCWNPTSFEMEDFPINKLRWIAVAAAVTHLVMYVDVDFIPSTAARDHILSFYQKSAHVVEQDMMSHVVKEHNMLHLVEEEPSHAKIHEGRAKIHEGPSRSVDDTEHVLVLPCFVTNGDSSWPGPPRIKRAKTGGSGAKSTTVVIEDLSKTRLLEEVAAGNAKMPGASGESIHSHGATNYAHWMQLRHGAMAYETEYTIWYEPYFVINITRWFGMNGRGLFDERFYYGGGDKAQLALEVAIRGYRFLVHSEIYIIHLPEVHVTCDFGDFSHHICDTLSRAKRALHDKRQTHFGEYLREELGAFLLAMHVSTSSSFSSSSSTNVSSNSPSNSISGIVCFPQPLGILAKMSGQELGDMLVSTFIQTSSSLTAALIKFYSK